MRDTTAFGDSRLGGADLEVAIHCDGIAIDDLPAEMLGQRQRKGGLPASCGAYHHD